jgi:flavin-binding protein dodecin
MATLKVIEVLAESDKSWEDAAQKAVTEAAETLEGIKSIYIKEFQAKVEGNRIKSYRINANITFELHGDRTKNSARKPNVKMMG